MKLISAVLLTLSVAIGYGADWSAYYVAIFQAHDLQILGRLDSYEIACNSPKTAESICRHAYFIPKREIGLYLHSGVIGTGIVLSATRYMCVSGEPSSEWTFDDPSSPGKLFDLMNRYQTVPLDRLSCDSGVLIEAWSRPQSRRSGYMGGTLVVGTSQAVDRVKRLSEFFTVDILILFGFLFLALTVLTSMLTRILSSLDKESYFDRGLWLWVSYIFFSSGLAQLLIPFTALPQISNRITSALSLICHLSVTVFAFGSSRRTFNSTKWLIILSAFCFIGMATTSFALIFSIIFTVSALLTLIVGVKTKEPSLLLYGVAFAITSLKILGVPGLPHAQVTTFYVGMSVAADLLFRFRHGAKLTRLIHWHISRGPNRQRASAVSELANEALNLVGEGRLTVLTIKPAGGCSISIYKNEEGRLVNEIYHRDDLPPLFAHTISTGLRAVDWRA